MTVMWHPILWRPTFFRATRQEQKRYVHPLWVRLSVLPSAGLILVHQILPSPQILQNLETSVGGDDAVMLGLQVYLPKLICMEDLVVEGLRTTVDSPPVIVTAGIWWMWFSTVQLWCYVCAGRCCWLILLVLVNFCWRVQSLNQIIWVWHCSLSEWWLPR